ncbi:hypothetical protein [Acinetobacter baumannii]|uniref:hypothetical protein n=1 Tax=Acinetobacter baumannii TaxID=470 RepID=UPI001D17DD34|nr:hypothetical protein [Acinetobacter baumannii]MDY7267939.1 hypothetical protein [Acinetobacter baumannii]MDY7303141.1 hypothetical protein [Acinetobacter baumannii]MDY7312567.1 hypothetical protein [Acinetobacter baumannii]MDY7316401.1 hypothetical protein [Acinetobacter baumannii]MDY7327722.1 hypothetical protein [Acinetobacter baumannii]
MSEFKVGDKVVLKSSSQNKVMTIQESYKEFIRAYWDKEHYSFAHKVNFRFAEDEEIAVGHRIDFPTLPKPVGSLQELHPEFAKVLNENFLELISDDPHTESRISGCVNQRMFEMDKCREEFEKQKYWIGLFRDAVDFDEELGRYVLNGQRKLYAFHLDSFNEKWAIWQEAWQHQQAKVEELKASHHGEVIGHEVHLKKIKQERDELQTLYTQQGINMFKLQKRVDAVIIEIENMYLSGAIGFDTVKKLEQALKGEDSE